MLIKKGNNKIEVSYSPFSKGGWGIYSQKSNYYQLIQLILRFKRFLFFNIISSKSPFPPLIRGNKTEMNYISSIILVSKNSQIS